MTIAKVKLSGEILLESGLHIGTSGAFAAIGATDSPIIKDPLTNLPIIPGSSIKGKMRHLLAKATNTHVAQRPNQDAENLIRLFGDSNSDDYKVGRLVFRDALLINREELERLGAKSLTEVKFENVIDRITAVATPRQIERAIRGSKFSFELIYEYSDTYSHDLQEDFQTILHGMKLLEVDYLGGSGSRGYGKVKFINIEAVTVYGDLKTDAINEWIKQVM